MIFHYSPGGAFHTQNVTLTWWVGECVLKGVVWRYAVKTCILFSRYREECLTLSEFGGWVKNITSVWRFASSLGYGGSHYTHNPLVEKGTVFNYNWYLEKCVQCIRNSIKIMLYLLSIFRCDLVKMNECFMAAWFAFAILFELNHMQNRQYLNGNMEFQEKSI